MHIVDETKSRDVNRDLNSNSEILSSGIASLLPPVTSYKQDATVSRGNINEQRISEKCRTYSGWGYVLQCLDSESERANVALIMGAANLGFRDIVKYGIVLLGAAIDDELFERASRLPFSSWIRSISEIIGGVDMDAVCIAGLRFLASLQRPLNCPSSLNPQEINSIIIHTQARTALNIYQTASVPFLAFASGCVANAHYLGISIHDLMDINAQSPFSSTTSITSPTCKTVWTQSIHYGEAEDFFCTSLAPTWEQLTTPHHPFIDTLPWPSFRSRVITTIYSEPPLTDQKELTNDLVHNGIRCYRIMRGHSYGNESFVPWDARNWKVEPWFFVKWQGLFDEPLAQLLR